MTSSRERSKSASGEKTSRVSTSHEPLASSRREQSYPTFRRLERRMRISALYIRVIEARPRLQARPGTAAVRRGRSANPSRRCHRYRAVKLVSRSEPQSAGGHLVADWSEKEPPRFADTIGLPRSTIAAEVVQEVPVVGDLVRNLPVGLRQLCNTDRRSRRDGAARRYRRPRRRTCTGAGALRPVVRRPEVQRVSVGPDFEDSLRTLSEADGEARRRRRTDGRQFFAQIGRSSFRRRRRDGRGSRRGGRCGRGWCRSGRLRRRPTGRGHQHQSNGKDSGTSWSSTHFSHRSFVRGRWGVVPCRLRRLCHPSRERGDAYVRGRGIQNVPVKRRGLTLLGSWSPQRAARCPLTGLRT